MYLRGRKIFLPVVRSWSCVFLSSFIFDYTYTHHHKPLPPLAVYPNSPPCQTVTHLHHPSLNQLGRGSTRSLKLNSPFPEISILRRQCGSISSLRLKALTFDFHSVKASQIRSGRGMRRIIDMFAHPVDLIMEKHRRLEDEASDEVASEPTVESVALLAFALVADILTSWQRGQAVSLIQPAHPACSSCKIT